MDSEKKNLKQMLINTVSLLCQNGLTYQQNLKIEGVIGVTVDDVVFLVHIDQTVAYPPHNDGHTNNDDDDNCYVDEKEGKNVIQNVNSGLGVLVKSENVLVPSMTKNQIAPLDDIKMKSSNRYISLGNENTTENCDDDVLIDNENDNNYNDCNIIATRKDENVETLVTKVAKPKKRLESISNKSFSGPSRNLGKKIKYGHPKSNQLSGNLSNMYTNNSNEFYSDGQNNDYYSDGQNNDYNTTEDNNFEHTRTQFYQKDENDYSNDDTTYNDTSLERGNESSMFGRGSEGGGKIRKSHQCQYPDCHKIFVRRDRLIRHQRIVHGDVDNLDQNYQDDDSAANSSFSEMEELKLSSNSEEGDGADKLRPHQCQYPDCGRTFIRKDHLVRHQRTFHGKQWGVDSQVIYFCSHCPRKFYKTFSLSRHLTEAHGITQH